jgi:cytochrome c553
MRQVMRPVMRSGLPAAGALLAVSVAWHAVARAEDAIGGDVIVTKGMKPWEGCGECHDLDGVAPNGHFPSLAGQKTAYFLKQMADFRDGSRHNDHGQMGVSSRLTAGRVLDEVAAYFAALPAPLPAPAPDAADVARGRLLVAAGSRSERVPACDNCHGPHPKHDFVAPCLEAQQPAYLAKQLEDFKAGRRGNDPQGVMRQVAARLSEADIGALAGYLAAQKRPAGGACAGAAP